MGGGERGRGGKLNRGIRHNIPIAPAIRWFLVLYTFWLKERKLLPKVD